MAKSDKSCGGLNPYIPADLKKAMKENSKKSTKKKVKKSKSKR